MGHVAVIAATMPTLGVGEHGHTGASRC
jgi:hypothetical protein